MKRSYISLIKGLLVLFISISSVLAFAAGSSATIQPNRTGLNINDTIHVPIHVSGLDILNMQFVIIFDKNVLAQNGAGFTLNPIYLGIFTVTYSYTYLNDSTMFIGFDGTGSTGTDFTGQKIADLLFTFKGGKTNLHIRKAPEPPSPPPGYSGIWDEFGSPITPYTFTDASVSGAAIDIHSTAGGGTWNTAAKWDLGVVPNATNNVFITLSNPITITTNVKCNNLTINSGGQLTLNSTFKLKANGNFSILDDGTNGSGSYVDLGSTTIGGTCSVQRNMNGNWTTGPPTSLTTFHYISSPVSTGVDDTFIGDLLNKYNEPLQQWDSLVALSIPLAVGKGYAAAPHTPGGTRTFSGAALNTGNLTLSGANMTFTTGGSASYRGYNLIGNPYPSALQWDLTWSRTNVDASVWVWDGVNHIYLANDGTTGSGNFANGVIPAEQGFFVHVTTAGSGTITIPNNKRLHNPGPQNYYKQDIQDQINLSIQGNNGWDETVIFFNSNATSGYDTEFDTYKLFSGSPVTEIYSVIGETTDATINVLPDYNQTTRIPVGIKTNATGSYTITASKLESFPSGTSIYLEDILTGQTVNLNNTPVYTFSSDAVNAIRFYLHFFPVGIHDIFAGKINIYSNLKDVYVNIPTSMHGNIVVYNLLGAEVANQVIQGNSINRISLNNPTGYYIVKVIGDSGIMTGKVFIQ